MCGPCQAKKRKMVPNMLNGKALSLINEKSSSAQPYKEAISILNTWFNSRKKQSQLLREWKRMRLTLAMESEPEASEMKVYRTFVGKMMRIKKQLETSYHGDRVLSDQLMTAIEIYTVQNSLKDRVPRGAQKLVNRVETRVSEKRRTGGSTLAYI